MALIRRLCNHFYSNKHSGDHAVVVVYYVPKWKWIVEVKTYVSSTAVFLKLYRPATVWNYIININPDLLPMFSKTQIIVIQIQILL